MNVWQELRRRRVFRLIGLYIVGAWLAIQVAATFFPAWAIPETLLCESSHFSPTSTCSWYAGRGETLNDPPITHAPLWNVTVLECMTHQPLENILVIQIVCRITTDTRAAIFHQP